VYLEKADGEPWTAEDHFVLAFDANNAGGSRLMSIAPGIQFANPVEYALQ